MDKNSVIGLFIIAVMIIGYSIYTQPSQEQLEQQKKEQMLQDSLKVTTPVQEEQPIIEKQIEAEPVINDSLQQELADEKLQIQFGDLANAASGEEKEIILENERFIATLSSKGGLLKSLELKEFSTYDSLPLIMFEQNKSLQDLIFDYPGFGRIHFSDLYFTPSSEHISLNGDDKDQLVLKLNGRQSGQELKIIYAFDGHSHDMKMSIQSSGFQGFDNFNSIPLQMDWNMTGLKKEKYLPWERNVSTIFYKYSDDSRDWLSETREDDLVLEQKTDWIAYKQNYFSVILFSDKGFAANEITFLVVKSRYTLAGMTLKFHYFILITG